MDQHPERRFAPLFISQEQSHQLAISPGADRPPMEKGLKTIDRTPGQSYRHDDHSRRSTPYSYDNGRVP